MESENKRVYVIAIVFGLLFGGIVLGWFLLNRFHVFGDEYPRRFYRAVIFDQGGVLVPFRGENDLEIFTNHLIQNPVDRQAYFDCEKGITTFEDIPKILEMIFPEISQVKDFESQNISNFTRPVNQDIIRAAQLIKQAGLKIAVLSNNYYWSHKRERTFLIDEANQFDVVVESCRVGMRKPNSKIYELTAKKLDVDPEECIMVDDVMSNLQGAKSVNMATVFLPNDNTTGAIDELERMLNMKLR
ncbi:Bifunctional epoxide hydrolase 2 [Aphelenchoides besseyi]|nr:Bifunctional epoxide hydrolase 2 [Aphelenchoides besseyi]